MIAHDKTLKVTKSTDLMPPPSVSVVRRTSEGKGKGKVVAKGNVDDEYSKDPSYKNPIEVSAHSIVQLAS